MIKDINESLYYTQHTDKFQYMHFKSSNYSLTENSMFLSPETTVRFS